MTKRSIRAAIVVALLGFGAWVVEGAVIFTDNFDRADSSSLGSTSTGGLTWNEQETTGGLQISGNRVLAGSTTSGREYATVNLASASGYSTTLANNGGLVTWAINMRGSRTDPSGFDSGNYGLGFVLAANSADYATGSGYAVVLGQSGATDAIRLARFNGGLDLNSQFTDIVSGGDFGNEYLSIRVTYDPSGNNWSLFLDSSTTSFSDPTVASSQVGVTTSDLTYTGIALDYSGLLWNHATSPSDNGVFDNISISAVPEPAEWGLICAAGLLGVCGLHTWRERRRSQRLMQSAS